jgi:hypothetical protein
VVLRQLEFIEGRCIIKMLGVMKSNSWYFSRYSGENTDAASDGAPSFAFITAN